MKNETMVMLDNGNEESSIFVCAKEISKGCFVDEWETIISISMEDYEKLSTSELEEIKGGVYPSCDYFETGTSDFYLEPEKNSQIVVFSNTPDVHVGDDPYMWDFDQHFYFNISSQKEEAFLCAKDVEIIGKYTKRCDDFNHGRAVNYYIFKDGDEIIVGCDDEGFSYPVTEDCKFNSVVDAKQYIENEIGDC